VPPLCAGHLCVAVKVAKSTCNSLTVMFKCVERDLGDSVCLNAHCESVRSDTRVDFGAVYVQRWLICDVLESRLLV
jgi:hypothetical protein